MIGMSSTPLRKTHEEKTVQVRPDGVPLVEEWGGDVKGFLRMQRSALSYQRSAFRPADMSQYARAALLLMAES
jgi:hypothetical protein